MNRLAWLPLLLLVGGCSTQRPVLYPNAHMQRVGADASQQDIEACLELAEAADLESSAAAETAGSTAAGAGIGAAVGAAVGAVTGQAGLGAARGAAGGGTGGLLRGLFSSRKPDPLFQRYVETCLRERGHKPIGWK